MNTHKNASLTPKGRTHLINEIERIGLMPAAESAGISTHTARKWRRCFGAEGAAGLLDRSSRPIRSPQRSDPSKIERAIALRRTQRLTYAQIAERFGLSSSTGSSAHASMARRRCFRSSMANCRSTAASPAAGKSSTRRW